MYVRNKTYSQATYNDYNA